MVDLTGHTSPEDYPRPGPIGRPPAPAGLTGLRPEVAGHPADALLLDLDGTLVDSEPIHREGYRRAFTRRGWPCTDEDLAVFTGRRADDVFRTIPGPWDGLDPQALYQELVAAVPTDLTPEPLTGAVDLLDQADRLGIPFALVTSAGRAWAEPALAALGGLDRFAAVVTRDDVERGKPSPDCYQLAAHRLGVAPARCVAVEDAPAGVRAAVAAGVGRVVAVPSTHTPGLLREAGAHEVLPDR
ncbi:HAD family hydrolase [Arsenicicoccus dermatophilus]|uniref:HAD family hydrolase n=1 Tax=Arsenicicoccus dermatophilus TaxID=1076331 RepID=UPI003917512F